MSETKFSVMVSMFTWMRKSKTSTLKRSKFRKFLETFIRPEHYFSAIRLILPLLDRERGSYGLKEHALATCLIDALGMSRDSPDAQKLLNWRRGGPKSGAFAGNFSMMAAEVLQRRQGMASGGLTIRELNDLLDQLASCENRSEKTSILSSLIRKTNAQEMKWIIMIILKDLKLGISEKTIFHEFHPDAEDLFNVTCDLKLVCEKLKDRKQRHKRQDIDVGKPVRPQLALRVSNAASAWKKLHGKEVVVECKFDGDRIQIHKRGAEINFFSRNFLDHPEYEHGMADILRDNVLVDRCILDGEMLVWDTSTNRFAEFGSNQEIAKAAREGLDNDRQLCYVAFDILYVGDTSVIHQTLKERHELLRKVVKPIAGRLEILVPDGGLNAHRPAGEPCWSLIVNDVDSVERFFKETIENRDEGIVLKDLNSKWEPGDRSAKWLKLKPDYVRAGSDLDVLIIGGYYGSGRRGGEVAQFLVGLAERPAPGTHPRRFVSFCRVGTGLSDEELDAVVTKLKPYFRKYEYPKKSPPSFYQVTNNSKERPDVWVESPEKSIIVSVTSDIRTIRSEVFAAPYSLRFPRIDRVRFDKPWHECLDVQAFVELVHSSSGTTQGMANYVDRWEDKPKRAKSSRVKKNISVVPSHLTQTDTSHVKGKTLIFSNMVVYFVNVPPSHTLDALHKMIVENGGTFSMNLNNSVTHCIASESKGIKFQAAKQRGDVIHFSWLSDCCSQKKLLPLFPKNFLHLSDTSKKKLQEEIDEFSDSYFLDIGIEDFKQILNNIDKVEESEAIDHYKRKFSPKEDWILLLGCRIYIHLARQYLKNPNWAVPLELSMQRMKLEISVAGGSVAEDLSHATHLVIMPCPRTNVDFDLLLKSFSEAEIRLLHRKGLHVVKSQWLDDCFEKKKKLSEHSYNLKPSDFQEDSFEHNIVDKVHRSSERGKKNDVAASSSDKVERTSKALSGGPRKLISLPTRGGTRKRGRPSATATARKGKSVVIQPRSTRPKLRNKPATIQENESADTIVSSDNDEVEKSNARSLERVDPEIVKGKGKGTSSSNQTMEIETMDDVHHPIAEFGTLEDSTKGQPSELYASDHSKGGQRFDEAKEVGSQCKESPNDTADPVQAMLLNMVPHFGTQKAQSSVSVLEEVKGISENPIQVQEKSSDADVQVKPPSKKKKVSYKDVANELLKDW